MADSNETTISKEAVFTGRMTGADLRVIGRVEGEIELTGALRIIKDGRVKATVKAATVEIQGDFEGEIRASTLVFGETATARGKFLSDKLSIREGAVVEGSVNLDRTGGPRSSGTQAAG